MLGKRSDAISSCFMLVLTIFEILQTLLLFCDYSLSITKARNVFFFA